MNSGLTVVIPSYNMATWLPTAIESCLDQTCRDIEVLIVDDGSTDATGRIADHYAGLDDRIRVVHQENAGLGPARAKGQELANKKYLHFLDADDALSRDAAAVLVGKAEEDGADLVSGNAIVFSDRTGNTRNYFPHPEASNLVFRDAPRYWKSKVVWRWIFRTEFVRENELKHLPFRMGQDVLFMYEALTRAKSFSQTSRQIYYFRQEHKSADLSLDTYVNHLIAHYLEAKRILLDAAMPAPLVKYLNENYFRDMRRLIPTLTDADEWARKKVIADSLSLFDSLPEEFFTEDPFKMGINPEALPLFLALIRKDLGAVDAELTRREQAGAVKDVNKFTLFHTVRRRIKSMLRPMSIAVRGRLRDLEGRARVNMRDFD